MCTTCGCSGHSLSAPGNKNTPLLSEAKLTFTPMASEKPDPTIERVIQVEKDLLAKNDQHADQNRQHFKQQQILALNLVSSPGSGKTSLLVETIHRLKADYSVAVIEGDQQTENDAKRIKATGAEVIQVNTGKGCHLDAQMIQQAIPQLRLQSQSFLMIENVGNLVCPASFDLGEHSKVVVLSVTEGEDKPLKYPDMFQAAGLMLLNKIDLLPYLDFDVDQAIAYARQVNPRIEIIQLSARSGEGMDDWLNWLTAHQPALTEA